MIELDHVTKMYGKIPALRDVSFRISEGETVGLLGLNGAGKTTALNLMTGYFPPTKGRVSLGGKDMLKEARACKRMIGYLPERPPLYDEMTVTAYLKFVCELREVDRKAIPAHVKEIMALCGLNEVQTRLLGHLSKGYRQRVGVAQALCGTPDLLIFDEPTVGLDPKQTVEIRELIRRLSKDHTVVFSSHILSEVQQLCSRVIILHEGRIARDVDLTRPEEEAETIQVRLKIAGKTENVLNRLKHTDGVTGAEALPEEEAGTAEIRITCPRNGDTGAALDRVYRMLADTGLPVRTMREEKETLEEIFLRIIKEEEQA